MFLPKEALMLRTLDMFRPKNASMPATQALQTLDIIVMTPESISVASQTVTRTIMVKHLNQFLLPRSCTSITQINPCPRPCPRVGTTDAKS